MSSPLDNTDIHIDLIDFHVGSPVIPNPPNPPPNDNLLQVTDSLIDTELPIFEQKLQSATSSSVSCHSRRPSIDVEDILIDIDSDEYDRDSIDGEEVEKDFLDLCQGGENGNDATSLPVDNFEALLVLKNLDDLLNATLEESENALDTNRNPVEDDDGSDEQSERIIVDCLEDLDNYLRAIDDYDSDSGDSVYSVEQSSTKGSASLSDLTGSSDKFTCSQEFNEELARHKLRQMEENYSRFVSMGVVNRGYVNTEDPAARDFTVDAQRWCGRRPSSACAGTTGGPSKRKRVLRAATMAATVRKERPRLLNRRNSLTNTRAVLPDRLHALFRPIAACSAPTSPETPSLDQERQANRCCTAELSCSSASALDDASMGKEDSNGTGRGTWLRTSMRRLQQLPLPGEEGEGSGGVAGNRLEVAGGDVRPVSAPSRLPPTGSSAGRSSRSRSRNSVSQEPNGRARSSSASSRSRRPRSLSSSVTSLASSVESTPSCAPPVEENRTSNSTQEASSNNARRYSFLCTGVAYGFLKHQALKAYENSKHEQKEMRRAQRLLDLEEKKRLSAEKDFEQIIAIFTPPPPPQPKIGAEEQGFFFGSKGAEPEKCESKYESIYNDDSNTLIEKVDSFDSKPNEVEDTRDMTSTIDTEENTVQEYEEKQITITEDKIDNYLLPEENKDDVYPDDSGYWIKDMTDEVPTSPDEEEPSSFFEPKE